MFEAPHRVLMRHAPKAASMLLAAALNRLLAPKLSAMQRGFLRDRVVSIGSFEEGLDCRVRWGEGGFSACTPRTPADLAISARASDYLRLLTREVDADALFFQRRLRLEGDIELGLAIKNMLDSMEMPTPLARILVLAANPRSLCAPLQRH